MFSFQTSEKLEKRLKKLKKKDPALFNSIKKKIIEVTSSNNETINHYKNLKGKMSHLKRVHVGSFVLLFRVKKSTIFFEDFIHHDQAY